LAGTAAFGDVTVMQALREKIAMLGAQWSM
jgi:hypothetical protein